MSSDGFVEHMFEANESKRRRIKDLEWELELSEVRLTEALAVLKDVEWVEELCPSCRGWKPHPVNSGIVLVGHAPDCRIARLLK